MSCGGMSHDYAYHPGPPPGHEQPAVDDLTEAVEKGKRCDSKDIYRVPTDEDPNKYHWVDEKPLQYSHVPKVSERESLGHLANMSTPNSMRL
jgi:hypothetical protein